MEYANDTMDLNRFLEPAQGMRAFGEAVVPAVEAAPEDLISLVEQVDHMKKLKAEAFKTWVYEGRLPSTIVGRKMIMHKRRY